MDRLPETYALSSDFLDFASSDYDAISADRVSKMRAKTGPVVPSVIRERRTAGRTETWSRSCEDFIADTKVAPSSKSAETNGLRLVNIFSLIALEPTISSFRLSGKFKFMQFFQQRHQFDMTYVVLLL